MTNNIKPIEEIKKAVEIFSFYDLAHEAYTFYKGIKEYVEKTNLKQQDPALYGQYYRLLLKLQFIGLNIFDDWQEVEDLIKNHFDVVFDIRFYDLWNKISIKLMVIPDLVERDKVKENLKKVLLDSKSVLIDKRKINQTNFPITVGDWLKDFIAHLGLGKIDKFKKVEYLTNSEYIRKLDQADRDKIKYLVNLYENLCLSSDSAEGIEEDVPFEHEGKLGILSKGSFNVIDPKVIESMKEIREKIGIADDKLNDLKQLLSKYPPGSLERKAVEEELEKLESGGKKIG